MGGISTGADPYDRLRLIPWWDQDLLGRSRVMVVGAGAIGNEVLKNLGLLGVGSVIIVDPDRVETSNLSRSVLFRPGDEGRPKVEAAAQRLRELNPRVNCVPLQGDIRAGVGLGVFRAVDIIIAGLDNREARLEINRACWRVNRPWVDGGIEVLQGVARVFVPPDGPCYECTLSDMDYRILANRKSCSLLQRTDTGKVPTTPTTASIIGGIEVQEAVRYLHRRASRQGPAGGTGLAANGLAGRGFFYEGEAHGSFTVDYQVRPDCLAHYTFDHVTSLSAGVDDLTLGDLLGLARDELGPDARLDFEREVVTAFVCGRCGGRVPVYRQAALLTVDDAVCPDCGSPRFPESVHVVSGDHQDYLGFTLRQFGLPSADIITAKSSRGARHYELRADLEKVLPGWTGGPPSPGPARAVAGGKGA